MFQRTVNRNMHILQNWTGNQCFVKNWRSNKVIAKFGFKKYLDFIDRKQIRIAITKLSVASHVLEIKSGRLSRPNQILRGDRQLQNSNSLEDDFLFVLKCPVY